MENDKIQELIDLIDALKEYTSGNRGEHNQLLALSDVLTNPRLEGSRFEKLYLARLAELSKHFFCSPLARPAESEVVEREKVLEGE